MKQTWRTLAFMHWRLDPGVLAGLLPAPFTPDTFDGYAWIGIAPFEITGLRVRGVLPLPGVSRFPELNLRTYTTLDGKPGVYFFSLDAASRLAVWGARRFYRLPYFKAAMTIRRGAGTVHFSSERLAGAPGASFAARYSPSGPARTSELGSLDYFLTERYCLYTVGRTGRPLRAEIMHPPWLLHPAEATIERNSLAQPWSSSFPTSRGCSITRRFKMCSFGGRAEPDRDLAAVAASRAPTRPLARPGRR